MTVQSCLDRLKDFESYQQNWCDGNYGEPINKDSINIAKHLISNVKNHQYVFVYPTLSGGVEVSFIKYSRDISIDIYTKPNSIDIWVDVFTDGSSDVNFIYENIPYSCVEQITNFITKLL